MHAYGEFYRSRFFSFSVVDVVVVVVVDGVSEPGWQNETESFYAELTHTYPNVIKRETLPIT